MIYCGCGRFEDTAKNKPKKGRGGKDKKVLEKKPYFHELPKLTVRLEELYGIRPYGAVVAEADAGLMRTVSEEVSSARRAVPGMFQPHLPGTPSLHLSI